MRIPRVFIDADIEVGREVVLPSAEARHLARVLRRSTGDPIHILAPGGVAFAAELVQVSHGSEVLRVVARVHAEAAAPTAQVGSWRLGLAAVKGPDFELSLRMASELGFRSVTPIFTGRSVVRWHDWGRKRERFERLVRESAKQCGRSDPLAIAEPLEFLGWLESEAKVVAPRWIAVPYGPPMSAPAGQLPGDSVSFAVGPEGGFTPTEVDAATDAGFMPCGFPTPVLRTPTAVALIAALGLVLGDSPETGNAG